MTTDAASPRPSVSRRSAVSPFIAMDVMAEAGTLARSGRDIVSLAVGEPGAPPPRVVREAVTAALGGGRVPYTDSLGLASLRARIARSYKDDLGLDVPAERIAVTTGSSGGFLLAFLSMFDVGDRIAIPCPGYPAYRNILEALGLVPVEIPTGEANRHALDGALIGAAHAATPLKGVLAMSPANPTGVVMPPATVKDIADTCARLGLWFISDEIYHGLVYEGTATSALAFSSDAVVVNSFSKYYCMTGWRVGWLVLPERLVRPVERLAQSLAISVPYLSQIAGEAAFGAVGELEIVKAGYAENRAILGAALHRLGLPVLPMDGAFYAYADISRYGNDSMTFCQRALHEAGVAITPGIDFDRTEGHRAVRLSYAGSTADMLEAAKRLEGWLKR